MYRTVPTIIMVTDSGTIATVRITDMLYMNIRQDPATSQIEVHVHVYIYIQV